MSNRIGQLDSIRGLASLTVVWHHMWMAAPVLPVVFSYSPLRILVYGHAAVILFFILSGFVLALPFLAGKQGTYPGYLVKRICRIYLPYAVSLAVALLAANLIVKGGTPGAGDWIHRFWNSGWDAAVIVEHLLLVVNIHTDAYNTVVWSLIHEMRISLVFPLIMLAVRRLPWSANLLFCLLLSSVSALNGILKLEASNGYFTGYFDTLHFASFFIIGALLAKHKDQLTEKLKGLGRKHKLLLTAAAIMLYGYSKLADSALPYPFGRMLTEYGIALGASIALVFAIGSTRLARLLLLRPVVWVGRVSYSLYLYHFIILLALVYLLNGTMPISIIYVLVFVLSLTAAALSHRYIEEPSARLGHRLSSRLQPFFRLPSRDKSDTREHLYPVE